MPPIVPLMVEYIARLLKEFYDQVVVEFQQCAFHFSALSTQQFVEGRVGDATYASIYT